MASLPCRELAGKFARVWSVSDGRERIVVGFYHPINPFYLKPDELAYVITFYDAITYKHELVATYPGVKNPFMFSGFLVLTKYTPTEAEVLDLWHQFEDVPTILREDHYTVTDAPFMNWPIGTKVEEIWHWFDQHWPRGVYNLMYEGGAAK